MAKARALVVEGSSGDRHALVRSLENAGYEVLSLPPAAAVDRLQREHFDVIAGPVGGIVDQLRLRSLLPLLRITETLVSDVNLATIATVLLERVREDGGAQVAWLVMEGETSMLEVSGQTVLEPYQLSQISSWLLKRFSQSIHPHAYATAMLLQSRDRRRPSITADWIRAEGWDQLVVVPLTVKRRRIGAVIAAGRDGRLRHGEADLRYLAVLAAQTAIAVENVRLYRRARTQSMTDPLTGIPNTRFLYDHLPAMLAQARRSRRPLSLLFIDSDSLKLINDRFGHAAGDEFVTEMAQVIRVRDNGVRTSDVVARYTAGDEFVVVMPDTDEQQASVVADRLRATIDEMDFVFEGHHIPVSISVGVACFPQDANTPDALIHCADQAMYEAKRRGKNRVVRFSELDAADQRNDPLTAVPPEPIHTIAVG